MDDEDAFLYGDEAAGTVDDIKPPTEELEVHLSPPISQEIPSAVVALLEAQVEETGEDLPEAKEQEREQEQEPQPQYEQDDGGLDEDEDESEDDIEFIMEPTARSLDLRQQTRPKTLSLPRTYSSGSHSQANLTTEYMPRERGDPPTDASKYMPSPDTPQTLDNHTQLGIRDADLRKPQDDGLDPSMLPPVTASPSHPSIDPTLPGTVNGLSIFEVDMANLAAKPWRRPGSDISDWFNYGFDEISWEAYCYRRRDMGELAHVLEANLMNFSGMSEEQLVTLPPDVRTMVLTGAHAMMSGAGPNAAMVAQGVGMNPVMDMQAMLPVGMNPMHMGMVAEMGIPVPSVGPMMHDPSTVSGPIQISGPVSSLTPEQSTPGPINTPEVVGQSMPGPGMTNMNIAGDIALQRQDSSPVPHQHLYGGMENSGTAFPGIRGGTPNAPFRGGRGTPRGRGLSVPRGRGRGASFGLDSATIPTPLRAASPLPPNVPTGPRNPGTRYKDRDNNAAAIDGLDYGGTREGSVGDAPMGDDDRSNHRKRRGSPMMDEERFTRNARRR